MGSNRVNRSKVAEEQVWCHRMRIEGYGMREISDMSETQCPTGRRLSVGTVHTRVNAELAAKPQASAAQLRELELSKLDDLERHVREVLARKHVKVSNGDVARDSETGEALVDDGPTLAAVRELNRISERRSKLLGIDAPQEVAMDATVKFELVGVNPDDL